MDLMVLPIVGMGGLGKTTFAQLIYNDDEIKNHFELQKWCCVSDDFDVSSIANNICQAIEKSGEKALHDLQSMISGKRYLIVLDDVWYQLTLAHKWEKLKTCLKQGGKGSAMLVAQIMTTGATNSNNIEKLSNEHLKEIIQSRVPFISVYKEKREIVRMLLDEATNMDLMVLPFLGLDEVDMTNFVQLIYYDPEIEKHFELQRWCCVPEDFHIGTIASTIYVTNEDHESKLKGLESTISGKRYLIVLDDVRNLDADKWVKLKTFLKQGGKGSAVLTTTRDPEVAQIMKMGVTKAYNIKNKLDEIVHWRAFISQNSNSDELYGIVDTIVGRCAGSPLAAKAFGSMLSTKASLNEWKNISAKSNICNERTEILPILKLSFDDLPPYMKQCFAFCAIFPKDYEIDKDMLIQLWMAHDFIPMQEYNQPETVGENIFKELTCKSFFQDVKQKLSIDHRGRLSLHNQTVCKIHDLMHETAVSVVGKECASIIDKWSIKKVLLNPTRHVFLTSQV